MREIAKRWLPQLERGDFNYNLLVEIGKECRISYRSSQGRCGRISLFVLEAICSRASALLESSADRFPDGNTEYHERVKTILEPALVGVLRAATAEENDQYLAVEGLLQAYVHADEL